MRLSITCLTLLFLFAFGNAGAQSSQDATVPLSATVSLSPNSVTLNWPNPSGDADLLVLRRTKGQMGNQWVQVLFDTSSTLTTYTDNIGIVLGQTYEYVIQRNTTLSAFGYAHVAVRAPVVDNRGKILIIMDSITADAIGVELVRMKNDMRGDGWVTTPVKIGPSATVQSVKAMITAAYNADPTNLKSVLLIGDVPIPYSGNANWDGHPEHAGAWPADSYYGDINGNWTDSGVNNTTPARDANDNVPGDGKFDQSIIPSAVELQVGRIDFRRLNAPAFGEPDAIGLVRRYLDKNHAWRTGVYTVQNKALVDDNFGYFGGESFASDGFRNAYPLVGASNIVTNIDFIDGSATDRWLLGYGCGGGNYQGASGIGSSTDFATKEVNIVFSNLFGSYFGDWDFETNPFMPSALASRGGILTCSWAGRPHWFNQALASGETIGFCHKETQNAQFNNGFFQSQVGESGAHTALLGDPTLRAHIVAPPTDVLVENTCSGVQITWAAPAEAVDGYHVYRSLSNDGPYARISTNMITGTTFLDDNTVADTLFYQVRAIKTQVSPGGGIYLNNSVGPIAYLVHTPATPPTITVQGGTLTCANFSIGLAVNSNTQIVDWAWSGPFGANSTNDIFTISDAGAYNVVVTDVNGCTATGSTFVDQNTIPPVLNIVSTGILTCLNLSSTLSVTSASALDMGSFQWSSGETTPTITVGTPVTFEVFVNSLDNGCPGEATFSLTANTALPEVDFPSPLTYYCLNACASVELPASAEYDYSMNGMSLIQGVAVLFCDPGVYTIQTVSNVNGCSVENDIEVLADISEPGASISSSGTLSCQNTSVQLMGSSMAAFVTYQWSGAGIDATNVNQQSPTVSLPGVYSLIVTDISAGCTSSAQFEVESDGSVPVITAAGGEVTCNDPLVTLVATSSIPNSMFLWTGPGGFSSTDQNPSTSFPGTYTLRVTAPSGCTNSLTTVVLNNTQFPMVDVPTNIPVLNCTNPCVTVQLIPITSGLIIAPVEVCAPGIQVVTVTGSNGCAINVSFFVNAAPTFSASLEPYFLDCDGSIAITALANGGTLPYSYLWSNGSTFSSALYFAGGAPISVIVSDAGGCSWESDTLTVAAVPLVLISANISNESGPGLNNGAISLVVTGGTPPFAYTWSNGATTTGISGLAGGTYTVTVTESSTGCTSVSAFTVETTSGTDEAAYLRSFALSPNPTTGLTTLTLKLDNQMPVKVEVRDVLGRLVLENARIVTADVTLPLDLSQQAAGVYNVAVLVDNQVFVRRLVVVK